MRVLRTTLWRGMRNPGMVNVVRDCDLADTLESTVLRLVDETPGELLLYQIFEMPEGDVSAATLEAGRRTRDIQDDEMNQSVLYYWTAEKWQRGADGATIAVKDPSPLSTDQIRFVLEQLAQRPDYRDFTVLVPSGEATLVGLAHGTVTSEPLI